jgi:hypothetical protein
VLRFIPWLRAVLLGLIVIGFSAAPDMFVCVGPGGHFAIELIAAGNCENGPQSGASSSRWNDGCPKGCHDSRLGADTAGTTSFAKNLASSLAVWSQVVAYQAADNHASRALPARLDSSNTDPPSQRRTVVILC